MSPPGTGIPIVGLSHGCPQPPSITISLQGSLETLQGMVCSMDAFLSKQTGSFHNAWPFAKIPQRFKCCWRLQGSCGCELTMSPGSQSDPGSFKTWPRVPGGLTTVSWRVPERAPSVVLKLGAPPNSLENLLITKTSGHTLRASDSIGLGWYLKICISCKFPGDTAAPGTTL